MRQLRHRTLSGWKAVSLAAVLLSLGASSPFAQAEHPTLQTEVKTELGILYVRISKALASDLDAPEKKALVTGVLVGSAADKAGLKRGDVILKAEGVWMTPGKSGPIEISRGGRITTLYITSKEHSFRGAKLVSNVTPRAQPKTIVVNQQGRGDYRTITGALAAAAFGDTLLIHSGTYREEVLLTSGITVQGEGAVRVESGFPLQIIGSQGITIRGLTVTGTNTGISIRGSNNITISDCDVEAQKEQGILIRGSRGVVVQGCSVSGNEKTRGIVIVGSQASVSQNIISQNGIGLGLGNKSSAEVSDNLFDANQTGVWVQDSRAAIKNNTITGTGSYDKQYSGIVFKQSKVTVEDNSVRRYKFGIESVRSQGKIVRNTVSQNIIGMQIQSSEVSVSRNVVMDNRFFGIQVWGEEGTDASRKATVLQNIISGNGYRGVYLYNYPADILGNLIEGNDSGITVKQSNATIRQNTIVLNRFGIQIKPNSQARIYNNIVAFNSFGISTDISSPLEMGFNDVYGNLARKKFPLIDGNYHRTDRLATRSGEKIHISIYPAYDLKTDTDLNEDPKFVKLGRDYRPRADSPLATKRGKDGAFIGAFPPAMSVTSRTGVGTGNRVAPQPTQPEGMAYAREAEKYKQEGLAYRQKDQHDAAVASYKEAIRLKPDHLTAHLNLGITYDMMSRSALAISSFKEVIRLKPDNAWAHDVLGIAYLKAGNRGKVLEEYKILKELDQDKAKNSLIKFIRVNGTNRKGP